jgi:hypothetical protein
MLFLSRHTCDQWVTRGYFLKVWSMKAIRRPTRKRKGIRLALHDTALRQDADLQPEGTNPC